MLILIINSGSSSLKYKLYQMQTEAVLAAGLIERIGSTNEMRLSLIKLMMVTKLNQSKN